MSLGVTLTATGRVMESKFAFINDPATEEHQPGQAKKKLKGKRRAASPNFDINLSQAVIDTQAREAIKDLFPKIPESDLHATIGRAFQKVRNTLFEKPRKLTDHRENVSLVQ